LEIMWKEVVVVSFNYVYYPIRLEGITTKFPNGTFCIIYTEARESKFLRNIAKSLGQNKLLNPGLKTSSHSPL
jgi:hypothetical protein